jgi:5-(carboxyamino)imidazole ribonucleotide mutase
MPDPAPAPEVKHLWAELETDGPQVGILMGSESDKEVMQAAADELLERAITFEMKVLSAHRDPRGVAEYASTAALRGVRVIIAGAGKAAALPGVIAAYTELPVIGVPMKTSDLGGMDSLLSIVQMPSGVPVATMSIGGARNAGLLAVRMLGSADPGLRAQMEAFQDRLADSARAKDAALTRDRASD